MRDKAGHPTTEIYEVPVEIAYRNTTVLCRVSSGS
jgi:hypothetical protein